MRSKSATSLARLPTQRLFDDVYDSSESSPILPSLVFIIIDLLFGGSICKSIGNLGLTRERERERERERVIGFGEREREREI